MQNKTKKKGKKVSSTTTPGFELNAKIMTPKLQEELQRIRSRIKCPQNIKWSYQDQKQVQGIVVKYGEGNGFSFSNLVLFPKDSEKTKTNPIYNGMRCRLLWKLHFEHNWLLNQQIKVKRCILLAKQMTQYENKKTKSPMSQHSWLMVPSSLFWFPKIQNFYIVELKIFF